MRHRRDQIKNIMFVALFMIAIVYGLSRAYPLLVGVKITVNYPTERDVVASSSFKISGQVTHAKEIKIQGRPVNIDTEGNFNETLVAHYPYTLIVLEATDKYENKVIKTIRVTSQ